MINQIKGFLGSSVYLQLVDEANYNPNAIELLEIINLTISSLIFFKENKITNRVDREEYNLQQTFNYIQEIYEQK